MLLSVVLFLSGACLVVAGAAWLSLPVAMIIVGAVAVAYALYRDSGKPAGPAE